MTVVHEDMAPIAQLRWMGIGFPRQQGLGIGAGAVGLVADLDAPKVAFCPCLALFGGTKALPRASSWRRIFLTINPFLGSV